MLVCVLLALAAGPTAAAQSRAKPRPRAQARTVAPAKAAQFNLVAPPAEAGSSARVHYPAAGSDRVPGFVVHGERPGPVIAYVFHGFSSDDAFYAEMEAIFGALQPAQMQGTVLALSLPARSDCEPACPPAQPRVWDKLAPSILNDARFVVETHMHASESTLPVLAFVYKAAENARLANYVESMARAALIPQLVQLSAEDLSSEQAEHLAPRSIELEHPAINIEAPSLEGNTTAAVAQLRKGLVNLLHHLKMAPGAVGWQNAVTRVQLEQVRSLLFPAAGNP